MRSRYILAGISLLFTGCLLWYFIDIVAYVLVAWVLSMIGQPLMARLQKIRLGKFKFGPTISAIVVLFTYFIVFGLLISLFVPLVVEQARNLGEVDYDAIAKALETPINQVNAWLIDNGFIQQGGSAAEMVRNNLQGRFDPSKIANGLGSVFSLAGNILIGLFSITFITFFFLKENRLFVDFLRAIVPSQYEDQVQNAVADASKMLTRYFSGVLAQVTLITLFVSISLSLFGVKNALLIGFFAALINVIPYLGPMIGAGFGVFITISSNLDLDFYQEMFPLLLKVLTVFAAMQMLDNFILQPLIFSNSVLAHPLEIFIIILIGSKLGGVIGMVLAIPAYTVLRVIAKTFLSEFKIVQRLTDGMDEVT